MRRLSLLAVLLLQTACDKQSQQTTAEPSSQPVQQGVGDAVVVLNETTLLVSPSTDRKVTHPAPGANLMINNAMGILHRGKAGIVQQLQPGWTSIKFADDALGWVDVASLIPQKVIKGEATLLQPAPYFADSATSVGLGVAPPGSLLFILEGGKPRTKVQLEAVGTVYVPTSSLVEDDDEVEMSHMIVQARAMVRMGDITEVSETLDDARMEHPTSPLLSIIADQVDFMHVHPEPYRATSHMTQSPFYSSFPTR